MLLLTFFRSCPDFFSVNSPAYRLSPLSTRFRNQMFELAWIRWAPSTNSIYSNDCRWEIRSKDEILPTWCLSELLLPLVTFVVLTATQPYISSVRIHWGKSQARIHRTFTYWLKLATINLAAVYLGCRHTESFQLGFVCLFFSDATLYSPGSRNNWMLPRAVAEFCAGLVFLNISRDLYLILSCACTNTTREPPLSRGFFFFFKSQSDSCDRNEKDKVAFDLGFSCCFPHRCC